MRPRIFKRIRGRPRRSYAIPSQMTQMWAKVALAAATLGIGESTLARMRYENLLIENVHYRKGGLNVTNPVFYDVNAIRSLLDWLAEDACRAKNEMQARWANFWLVRRRANERVAAQEAEELLKDEAENTQEEIVVEVQQVEQKAQHHMPPAVEPAEDLQGDLLQSLPSTADQQQVFARDLTDFLGGVICEAEKLRDKLAEREKLLR